jgi:hypothetical protein
MISIAVRHSFGQSIASHRLSPMAQDIASGMGDGQPARWAGFVWYRPEGLFQQNLLHRAEALSRPKAA